MKAVPQGKTRVIKHVGFFLPLLHEMQREAAPTPGTKHERCYKCARPAFKHGLCQDHYRRDAAAHG